MISLNLKYFLKQFGDKPEAWQIYPKRKKSAICLPNYGVTSHIHNFYCPPDKQILKSGEFVQGDEFQFLVEPKRKQNWWVRFSLWIGINLLLMGCICSVVGFVSPQQEVFISRIGEYIVVDRWAAVYNYRLTLCQLIGLTCLVCGSVVVFCALLLTRCERAQKREYYVMRAALKPERFIEPPLVFSNPQEYWGIHCIPSTGIIRGVQPGFRRSRF